KSGVSAAVPPTSTTTSSARVPQEAQRGSTAVPPSCRAWFQRTQPYTAVAMNITWRPAWPSRSTEFGLPKTVPRNTVSSSRLPAMPIGQAHTRRRIPPSALSSPKTLPSTSRKSRNWPPAKSIRASKSHCSRSISVLSPPEAAAPGTKGSGRDPSCAQRAPRTCRTCASHPGCTVGAGIPPAPPHARVADCHRRLGLPPTPEHVTDRDAPRVPPRGSVRGVTLRQFAQGGDLLGRILGSVDRGAGHEDVRAGLCAALDRLAAHAAVDLDRHLEVRLADRGAGTADLGQHRVQEALPAETGLDRHEQQHVELADDVQQRLDGRRGAQG